MRRPALLIPLTAAALVAPACGNDDTSGLPATTAPVSERSTTSSDAPTTSAVGEPAPAPADLATVAVGLTEVAVVDSPTAMVPRAGSDDLYVAERAGRVVRLAADGDRFRTAGEPVLDLTDAVGDLSGERGLLGLAFSPDGDTLYVNHTDGSDDGASVIASFAMSGDTADTGSRREILRLAQPFPNHNGGNIVIGPDGYLWAGFGDGGGQGDPDGNAQDRTSLLGKMLRIDVEDTGGAPYTVPADNPFVGADDARTEIWALGLRNPWRFSFDRTTGDLWIADVGGSEWEEVDLLPAPERGRGANLGWDAREGRHDTGESDTVVSPDMVDPIDEYGHDEGSSITGGFVYRGDAIPGLRGAYLYSDFSGGFLRAITVVDGAIDQRVDLDVGTLSGVVSFGEDAGGELYLLELGGRVLKLTPG